MAGEQVAIFGAGLLGGSLALALEAQSWQVSLHARRPSALQEWRASHPRSTLFISTQLGEVLAGSRLIVLAVPPLAMKPLLEQIFAAASEPESLLVTDVGSVKGEIEAQLLPLCKQMGAAYLGSHPMAGGEQSGLEAARSSLFQGSVCALCAHEDSKTEDLLRVRNLWQAVGCEIVEVDARKHDAMVAKVSHGVHFCAAALMRAAAKRNDLLSEGEALALAGSGIKDSTRIAASEAALWLEIAQSNQQPLLGALTEIENELGQVRKFIEEGDWKAICAYLEEAAYWRRSMSSG